MSTQTRKCSSKYGGLENHGAKLKQKSRIPVVLNRNALAEISNLQNRNSTNTGNNIKINENILSKKRKKIEINDEDKLQLNKITNNAQSELKEIEMKSIENIDELYKTNLYLVTEFAEDIYNYLRNLEMRLKVNKWPLNRNVTAKMRATLIDWLVEIHLEYDLLQETLHLCVSLVDRYIQASNNVTSKNLQLIGASCMFIASKYEEVLPFSQSDFLYLCNNTYTKCEFIEVEQNILRTVDFELGRPLSIHFLRRYSLAYKADRRQHTYAKYLLDLALIESSLCHVKPSLIAASAFYISICLINDEINQKYWTDQLIYYSKYNYNDFKMYIGKICRLVTDEVTYLETVKKKYSRKEFESVSQLITMKKSLLNRFSEVV